MPFTREQIARWIGPLHLTAKSSRLRRPEILADILYRRFCLETPETYKSIAASYRIAPGAIRQHEALILHLLRHDARRALIVATPGIPRRLWSGIFGMSVPYPESSDAGARFCPCCGQPLPPQSATPDR